jgi:putative SOS response-associated peptidase YedK
MCGRYTHMYTWEEVHAFLCLDLIRGEVAEALYGPHYNVAPTQSSLVARARADGKAELVPMRWGLAPHWSKDPRKGPINARGETVRTNGMFRAAFAKRRAIIPVSGFYEWQTLQAEGRKQPWYFSPNGAPIFAFAGLWEVWGEGESKLETFTIVMTDANEFIAPLHDRMPVILPREAHQLWLFGAPDEAAKLMVPAPGTALVAHRVSERVNRPRENGPDLIRSID